ncbi:MAG: hypothetical protein LBH11_04630 [Propionibacteriaceae bacterium]|jgi:hypothetical protein|nr:hypothetical protein [Propionibacteriaceae bacterium]
MRKMVGAVLLAIGVLLSSGCATPPNAAFIVDGAITTGDEIEDLVQACARAFQQDPHTLRSQVVSYVLEGRIAAQIMVEQDIKYSDTEREEILRSTSVGNTLLRDPACQQVGYGVADYALLLNQLGMEAFIAAQEKVEIVLNPRYGYWDDTAAVAVGNGSLSEAAAVK